MASADESGNQDYVSTIKEILEHFMKINGDLDFTDYINGMIE